MPPPTDDDQHHDHDVVVDSAANSVTPSSVVLFDLPPSLPRPLTTTEDDPVDANAAADDGTHDTERRVVHHDEVSSYTSATSATTASSREGDIADHRTRPRSASLHVLSAAADDPATGTGTGTSRAGSRERASSHGRPSVRRARTRTPLRRESPLLILRRPVVVVVAADRPFENGGDDDDLGFSDGNGDGGSEDEVVAAHVHVQVQDDGNSPSIERQALPPVTTPMTPTTPSSSRSRQADRRNRNRPAIPEIPHEEEEEEEQPHQQQQPQPQPHPQRQQPHEEEQSRRRHNPTTSTRAGHWLSRAAAAPAPSSSTSSRRRPRSSHPTRSRLPTLSSKQRPSHRKLRRWNNDRFVDLDHATDLEELYHHPADPDREDDPSARHLYWKEHYMPNYPLRYRSAFAALARDETATGTTARERFVKGEVGKPRVSIGGEGLACWRRMAGTPVEERNGNDRDAESERGRILASYAEREIIAKLRKMGVADAPALVRNDESSRLGKELFRSLAPRVRAVLSRSCHVASSTASTFSSTSISISSPSHSSSRSHSADADATSSSSSSLSAERIVHALERYLASLAHGISHVHHVPDPSVFDVLRRILAGPPRIVLKNRHPLPRPNCGAVVPTVHFHFSTTDEDHGADAPSTKNPHRRRRQTRKGASRSGAFHRILLHAVCRFHGLETSSTVRSCRDEKNVVKAVAVQGGIMVAPSLRLLDFVEEA
eukprot:CAMPEP_0171336368 /NCGR_PEP_ID=MMETSP0878-20121228/5992_1 /TAXON_ID=67004 /ORGANISM="Thalassiosira weissflogii, Strain CCMP1336" /LENGTH=715 /DNA_ID=CAMNT_0011837829 /DNA_START=61 /DNA_END=2208 /DNA_ORIENTATION=+